MDKHTKEILDRPRHVSASLSSDGPNFSPKRDFNSLAKKKLPKLAREKKRERETIFSSAWSCFTGKIQSRFLLFVDLHSEFCSLSPSPSMDEIWEKAIETALNGETDCHAVRTLTLDGAVKCFQLRFPPPALLEKFENLQHLSVANAGVSSLENFPHLPNLQKLVLSDNRISGGLEFLFQAGLESLCDLDLSNNRIQYIEDLAPLSQLKLQSLDLYECPVTKIDDYRSSVFKLIRSLKYLDKMDAEENERSESEEEDDDEDDDEEEDEEDEPGSGEVAGELNPRNMSVDGDTVLDIDEDEESDTDEEDGDVEVIPNGFIPSHRHSNGFRVASMRAQEDNDYEDDDIMGRAIVEVDGPSDDVVEVHEIDDSENSDAIEEDEDDDGEEDEEEEDDDDEDEEDADEVEDEEDDVEALSIGRVTSEGEIDGHDHGEDDDENGEIGEEQELSIEEDGHYEADEVEDEDGTEFLVQPIGQPEEEEEEEDVGGINFDEDDSEQEEVDDEGIQGGKLQVQDPSTSSQQAKRKRNKVEDADAGEEEEEDDGVQNGEVQFHPSTSQIKRKRNGEEEEEDDDSEDEDDISVEDKFRRHH